MMWFYRILGLLPYYFFEVSSIKMAPGAFRYQKLSERSTKSKNGIWGLKPFNANRQKTHQKITNVK